MTGNNENVMFYLSYPYRIINAARNQIGFEFLRVAFDLCDQIFQILLQMKILIYMFESIQIEVQTVWRLRGPSLLEIILWGLRTHPRNFCKVNMNFCVRYYKLIFVKTIHGYNAKFLKILFS